MLRFIVDVFLALLFITGYSALAIKPAGNNVFDPRVALTICPRTRQMVVHWNYSNVKRGDRIVITDEENTGTRFDKYDLDQAITNDNQTNSDDVEASGNDNYSLDQFLGISVNPDDINTPDYPPHKRISWRLMNSSTEVRFSMPINEPTGWWKTELPYDLRLTDLLTINTTCYSYWVYLIDSEGQVIKSGCLSAHPRWMTELRDKIQDIKFRNLFIPGSHDSGSYKKNFPIENDITLFTKYSITQDDDIRSQLMHGIRYLDLRVGYYSSSPEKFFINHGITKFGPLINVLNAVKDFVRETNEIVIIDFQEFPIGFEKNKNVHKQLAHFIYENMKGVLVPPFGSWDVTPKDVWATNYNVIIGYDVPGIQFEFRDFLWESVEQRWANAQNLSRLVDYLKRSREHTNNNYRLRPVAEMAELTPTFQDVIMDRLGGLRKMAESTNKQISEMYSSEFGLEANTVAVDFYMSTTIIDSAIHINALKKPATGDD